MDKELRAAQRIVKILSELEPTSRANVLSYVGRRAEQEHYNAEASARNFLGGGAMAGQVQSIRGI